MSTRSRSENSILNAFVGISGQVITLLLTFVCRTIFIATLGAEYLGVNGLYSSILTVLSLAELGIGNVMIYSLYQPIKDKDETAICALLNYYKGIYRKIALAVFLLGISIVPLLNIIINSDLTNRNLVLYYLLFLVNSVASYLVAYKIAIINANQKNYIITLVNTVCNVFTNVIQIVILLTIKSYILYLSVMVISTIMNNIILSRKANQLFPFLKQRFSISENHSKEIKKNIKSMFIFKVGHVVINNTDNILISLIVGTIFVGYYSNYSLIVNTISTFIYILIQAMHSSIGNLNAERETLKSFKFFNVLLLFFHWLSAFCSLCFLVVFNDFITIWIGENYTLETSVVIAIVLNFYIQNIINPVWIYRETMGLFNQVKYLMIYAAMINLLFSSILGVFWGLEGIIISTAIARIFTTVWYEPRLLFREKLKQPVSEYWSRQSKYFITTIVAATVAIMLTKGFPLSLTFIFLKILVCFLVISGAFLIIAFRSEEYTTICNYAFNFKRKLLDYKYSLR